MFQQTAVKGLLVILSLNPLVFVLGASVAGVSLMGRNIYATAKDHHAPSTDMTAIETRLNDHLDYNDERLNDIEKSRTDRRADSIIANDRRDAKIQQIADSVSALTIALQKEEEQRYGDEKVVFGFMSAVGLAVGYGYFKKSGYKLIRRPEKI
jgi:hypothetical protein